MEDGLGNEPTRIALDDGLTTGGAGELSAMMLDTRTTFDAPVRRHATDEPQSERILSHRFYGNIAGAPCVGFTSHTLRSGVNYRF